MGAYAIVVDVVLVLGLLLVFANAGRLLGPRPMHLGDAELPYETGMRPIEPAADKMAVLYYRFAVLFVVFDVDLAFLLPWAFARHSLALAQMVSITVFTALIGLMLAYFWRKGALECR
jgi:NADH:ubiquinone oxidoreductase subunit 3 (subunit A)